MRYENIYNEMKENYFNKIVELDKRKAEIEVDLFYFIKKYKSKLKEIMPKIGRIYQIVDKELICDSQYERMALDEDKIYYAKIISNRLEIKNWYNDINVKASIIDCNEKIILYERNICISHLSEISVQLNKQSQSPTQVYVMIDKNTGYYKIGRSKNPKYREITLQSEKPTIEMIHTFEAKNEDEKNLHLLFQNKRIRGEWFDLSGSDLYTINNYFKQNK